MIRLFTGHDAREEVGTWVFASSVLRNCSEPVQFMPLYKPALESAYRETFKEGTNAFTASRFLIPALCDFSGMAIFADGADMVCRGDLAELMALHDPQNAVSVVKHDYVSRHERKYIGTRMEARNEMYPRKNWASLMVINCAHPAWRAVTPANVANWTLLELLQLRFLPDSFIGSLPLRWNWLADEYGPSSDARILHWTAGIPGFPAYADADMAPVWRSAHERMNYATD
jgi:hypothetical protein